jgi:hypothetical protein
MKLGPSSPVLSPRNKDDYLQSSLYQITYAIMFIYNKFPPTEWSSLEAQGESSLRLHPPCLSRRSIRILFRVRLLIRSGLTRWLRWPCHRSLGDWGGNGRSASSSPGGFPRSLRLRYALGLQTYYAQSLHPAVEGASRKEPRGKIRDVRLCPLQALIENSRYVVQHIQTFSGQRQDPAGRCCHIHLLSILVFRNCGWWHSFIRRRDRIVPRTSSSHSPLNLLSGR